MVSWVCGWDKKFKINEKNLSGVSGFKLIPAGCPVISARWTRVRKKSSAWVCVCVLLVCRAVQNRLASMGMCDDCKNFRWMSTSIDLVWVSMPLEYGECDVWEWTGISKSEWDIYMCQYEFKEHDTLNKNKQASKQFNMAIANTSCEYGNIKMKLLFHQTSRCLLTLDSMV